MAGTWSSSLQTVGTWSCVRDVLSVARSKPIVITHNIGYEVYSERLHVSTGFQWHGYSRYQKSGDLRGLHWTQTTAIQDQRRSGALALPGMGAISTSTDGCVLSTAGLANSVCTIVTHPFKAVLISTHVSLQICDRNDSQHPDSRFFPPQQGPLGN